MKYASIVEVAEAYKSGAIHKSWTLTIDNDATYLYVPVSSADRARSQDDVWAEQDDPDTVCVFRMHPADLMPAALNALGIHSEPA